MSTVEIIDPSDADVTRGDFGRIEVSDLVISPGSRLMWIDHCHRDINASTESDMSGRRGGFRVPSLSAALYTEMMQEITPLVERVCDGYSTVWTGTKDVGRYTEDATEAVSEIEAIVDAEDGGWVDRSREWELDEFERLEFEQLEE